MKVIGSEIGLPVVIFPFQTVLTKWYGESESMPITHVTSDKRRSTTSCLPWKDGVYGRYPVFVRRYSVSMSQGSIFRNWKPKIPPYLERKTI